MTMLCKIIGHKFWITYDSNPWGKVPTSHCQRCGKRNA